MLSLLRILLKESGQIDGHVGMVPEILKELHGLLTFDVLLAQPLFDRISGHFLPGLIGGEFE